MYKKVLMAAAAAAVVALAAGCGSAPAPAASSSPSTAVSAADKAGAKLFVEYACVHCHGVQGDGQAKLSNGQPTGAPALNAGVSAAMVTQYLSKGPVSDHILSLDGNGLAINSGQLNMPYWYPFLTSQQVNDLATYIADGLPKVSGSDQALPATTGPEIYQSFACVQCHGPYNSGHNVNPGAIKGHGDHFIPTLGPKGSRFASAVAHWTAPFKTRAKNTGYFKYNPGVKGAAVTGQQFVVNKLLLGSIIHDGVAGGATNAVFMPAWGQLMSQSQITTLVNYLKTGQ